MISTNSVNNVLKSNLIINSSSYGAFIDATCYDNIVSNNSFIDNGINAKDDGTNNNWDTGTLGNYWDDYSGNDKNDDGIGDISYNITGSAGSVDNYPIWEDGEDEEIPGYPLFFVIIITGILSIVIAIKTKRRFKK